MLKKWLEEDRDAFLEAAEELSVASDDRAPRQGALYARRPLAFGGRKPEKPPAPIIRSTGDGRPLATKTEIADCTYECYGRIEMGESTGTE
eukprot:6961990-Pyramimonas_sp.AAC.1